MIWQPFYNSIFKQWLDVCLFPGYEKTFNFLFIVCCNWVLSFCYITETMWKNQKMCYYGNQKMIESQKSIFLKYILNLIQKSEVNTEPTINLKPPPKSTPIAFGYLAYLSLRKLLWMNLIKNICYLRNLYTQIIHKSFLKWAKINFFRKPNSLWSIELDTTTKVGYRTSKKHNLSLCSSYPNFPDWNKNLEKAFQIKIFCIFDLDVSLTYFCIHCLKGVVVHP